MGNVTLSLWETIPYFTFLMENSFLRKMHNFPSPGKVISFFPSEWEEFPLPQGLPSPFPFPSVWIASAFPGKITSLPLGEGGKL